MVWTVGAVNQWNFPSFDLYGAAQHVSENNLTGLGQVIPTVIGYDIQNNTTDGSDIDMGKQQNVESWLVNSFFHSPLQAYKPLYFMLCY